jgi:hypothetical protein
MLLLALLLLAAVPRPAHTVVIIEENKSYRQIIGNPDAPFINELARQGANFSNAHGVTHPSLPNYFALFAGITNANGDRCPARGVDPHAPNLASELLAAHDSFVGYAESLPARGFTGCWAGRYARKHVPWIQFDNVPAALSMPFTALPSFDRLPTVAFIVPNLDDDMHDGSIAAGDAWLKTHLEPLFAWAKTHDTLVILTWDEGVDYRNDIPTIFWGPMIEPGTYSERIDHYSVLRTLERAYGLPLTGAARTAPAIEGIWRGREQNKGRPPKERQYQGRRLQF